jgi:very-short-patch-repair endonuclease
VRLAVDDLLERRGGVATRADLLTVLPAHAVDDEIRRGRLVRVFRRAYCRPWDADRIETVERAAVASVGPPIALSHLTALRRWGLIDAPSQVHVSIPAGRMSRPQPGLAVHRVDRPPPAVLHGGLPTVSAAAALVSSWPLLPARDRRAPIIAAARRRLVTPARLRAETSRHPRLPGRRDLDHLVDLLVAGCESELEIWGLLEVFDVPGLRHGVRQRRITVRGVVYRLDLAYDVERVAVELDGDRFHSSRDSRDRDRRRDAALATSGWVTLRFTWDRLHEDVAGCRRDTLATLARRRVIA